MIPSQQTMDDNLISRSTLPEIEFLFYFNKITILLAFFFIHCLATTCAFILLPCRQKTTIASRLQAVIEKCIAEMDSLLALMKRWESRPCRKVNGCRNDEDTVTRLRSFFNAMESLDLTNMIYELRGLSSHLNFVTKRLTRSRLSKAIELITVWIVADSLYQVLVSEG